MCVMSLLVLEFASTEAQSTLDAQGNASKFNLLLQMGIFTLDASSIKGFARKFARSHPMWIGLEGRRWQTRVVLVSQRCIVAETSHVTCISGTGGLSSHELSTLEYENSQHNDLLLLTPFHDSYANLTAKVLESFKWIDKNFDSKFVFKADDDTFARLDVILDELRQKDDSQRLYWGFFDGRARVKQSGPWAEKNWHLCDTYLPHARGGGYVLSSDLVHYIAKNSGFLQKFNSEDISVGAWLAPVETNRVHDPRFDTEYKSRGCSNQYIVTHKQEVQAMRDKYESLRTTGLLCRTEYKNRNSYVYNWDVPASMCCSRDDPSIP